LSTRTIPLDDALYAYLLSASLREPEVMKRLREETQKLPRAGMQISPEQGQFMAFLVELIGARRCVEIGTFTGYSALAVARALPPDGRLVACDVSRDYTALAKPFWKEAGVEDRIDLRIAPALDTLDKLLTQGEAGTYDFVFIDADKGNYLNYFQRALDLLRQGGLVAVDNVLWSGAVADPTRDDEDTEAIREFNRAIAKDARVRLSMVPIGDGLTLALKR
jgi:caffeoyl-CoA O-methyltransferase